MGLFSNFQIPFGFLTKKSVLISTTTITASGNFTIPSGANSMIITCIPSTGGGAGGVMPGYTPGLVRYGGGGGGGGYATNVEQQFNVSSGTVYTITIGSAGAGGLAGLGTAAGVGSPGGTTTIAQGATTLLSVSGGNGGGIGTQGVSGGFSGGTGGTIGGNNGTNQTGGTGGINPLDTLAIGGTGGQGGIRGSTGSATSATDGTSGTSAKVIIKLYS